LKVSNDFQMACRDHAEFGPHGFNAGTVIASNEGAEAAETNSVFLRPALAAASRPTKVP